MTNNTSINYNESLLIESYFKTKSTKKFYLNVMNNVTLSIPDYENMYVRKEHGFAHIAVTYYKKSESSNFRDFDERKYYYVTRIQANGILQLRKDLIERWSDAKVSDVSVLVIDEKHNKVAEIPVNTIIGMKADVKQAENLDLLCFYNIDETSLIWNHVTLSATENEAKALMAEWQYLGNVAYAKYRENTLVKVVSYDVKNGKKRTTRCFKSIKQAYDMLTSQGFDMSYKTFQRRCKAAKPSLIETEKFTFYVTDKADFEGPDYIEEC